MAPLLVSSGRNEGPACLDIVGLKHGWLRCVRAIQQKHSKCE